MYYYIEKYSEEYKIPRKYAYGVAYAETRYRGPVVWKYNHAQTSYAGALGPMQIMPATAKLINGRPIPNSTLKSDIELNVETSMKLLRRLKNKYGDWKVVFGCYNTGRPIVNDYAHKVYNYDPQWAPTAIK
jgi:soluble lytic murein transglycosylase-like protein